ncbi:MAG: GNAT family N-acetyltransferase [Methylocystaceae bacterium]
MGRMQIAPYRDEYREQVIELILHIQRQEFNLPITREDQPDICSINDFYLNPGGSFFVALDQDLVVGTIGLLNIGSQQGVLRKMFVKQQYRGKVYHTAYLLLTELLSWAYDHNFNDVFLGTTPWFLAAHRFYEKHGFQEITASDLPPGFPIMKVDTKFYYLPLNSEGCRR